MEQVISLAAVGDITLGDSEYFMGKGVRSVIEKNGGNHVFQKIQKQLGEYDIVFGNLENVLSDHGVSKNQVTSAQNRGKASFARNLADAHFSVLSVANNHMLEHGNEAMQETISALENNSITAVGLPEIHQRKNFYKNIVQVKDVKIAFLAYCLKLETCTQGLVPTLPEIICDVRFLKNQADLVVVSLHWGVPHMYLPTPRQVDIAHRLIDNGATVILGHHPHVLQGVEIYRGGLIAYSLGNLVYNSWNDAARQSMILEIELTKEGLVYFDTKPIKINNEFQPELIQGQEEKKIREKIFLLSREIKQNHMYVHVDEEQYDTLTESVHKAAQKKRHIFIAKQLIRISPRASAHLIMRYFKKNIFRLKKDAQDDEVYFALHETEYK